MTLPADPKKVPESHLVVFIGHSSDADAEATVIYGLEHELQKELDQFAMNSGGHCPFSRIHVWKWAEDGKPAKGGQAVIVTPYIQRADIAVFVFKNRMGKVTWEELESVRRHDARTRYVITAHPAIAPANCADTSAAVAWADLLQKLESLTANWMDASKLALLPSNRYTDETDLQETVRVHLVESMRALWQKSLDTSSTVKRKTSKKPRAPAPKPQHFLDELSQVFEYDSHAVKNYRQHLRPASLQNLPRELTDGEFLDKAGFRTNGELTRTGALLFTGQPDSQIAGAATQCTLYYGTDKAADRKREACSGPVFAQIEKAFEFVKLNIDRTEAPDGHSARSVTTYVYPMEAVREIIANAICHRDYRIPLMCYVRIFQNRIEIANPGNWAGQTIPEKDQVFDLRKLVGGSTAPNYRLAHAFAAVDLVEMEGSGLPRAVEDCNKIGAPQPTVHKENDYIVITIYPGTVTPKLLLHNLNFITVEGPDGKMFAIEDLPVSTTISEFAWAIVHQYPDTWPTRNGERAHPIVDQIQEDGSSNRLNPKQTFLEANIREWTTLRVAPERTAGCFPPNTTIKLANKSTVPISEIKVGAEVQLGMAVPDGRMTSPVLAVERKTVGALVQINNALWISETQPLHVNGRPLQVKDLRLGDILLYENGQERSVTSLKKKLGMFKVFNLVLQGAQDTFIAGGIVAFHMDGRDPLHGISMKHSVMS